MEWGLYRENCVIIGQTADVGDNFKNRAAIPLAPCREETLPTRSEEEQTVVKNLQAKQLRGPSFPRLQ